MRVLMRRGETAAATLRRPSKSLCDAQGPSAEISFKHQVWPIQRFSPGIRESHSETSRARGDKTRNRPRALLGWGAGAALQ